MGTDETHEPKRLSARLGLSSPFILCICLGAVCLGAIYGSASGLLRSAVAKNFSAASIEADLDLAEVEPLLALVVGHEVFLGQALVGETGVILIDKDGFHHAGAAQNFDVLRGRRVGQAQTFSERLDVFAAAAAQDIDDLPAGERAEHRTEVGHAASVDVAAGRGAAAIGRHACEYYKFDIEGQSCVREAIFSVSGAF